VIATAGVANCILVVPIISRERMTNQCVSHPAIVDLLISIIYQRIPNSYGNSTLDLAYRQSELQRAFSYPKSACYIVEYQHWNHNKWIEFQKNFLI
jgi:hypothetical protein